MFMICVLLSMIIRGRLDEKELRSGDSLQRRECTRNWSLRVSLLMGTKLMRLKWETSVFSVVERRIVHLLFEKDC